MIDTVPGPLTSESIRKLKARGQLLQPTVWVGKAGFSDEFRRHLEAELGLKELVKVKFVAFQGEKKVLAKQLAADSRSHLIMRVGNVAVLFRQNSDPTRRKFDSLNTTS